MNHEELYQFLKNLIEWDALELHWAEEKQQILIPYVMNDAVECYIQLSDCLIQGTFEYKNLSGASIHLIEKEDRQGLILYLTSDDVVSIWFRHAEHILNCYQYHQIGHGWRRDSGEEDLRRLVNLVCVLHDKWTYLGQAACLQTEQKLARLAEFAPFLYYTPINESITDWYPQTEDGIEAARQLAEMAKDASLNNQLMKYQVLFKKGKIKPRHIKNMAYILSKPEHRLFWRKLQEFIEKASAVWPVRLYDDQTMKKICDLRQRVVERYQSYGFVGNYPHMINKDCNVNEATEVYFVDEQPFTVMESEHFKYCIYSLTYDRDQTLKKFQREESSDYFYQSHCNP